ncbi:YiaA/YiaB family inner membrane protein [Massilia sp. W12]|uniref:YiaA/YiaB family inner membrane protein n=1 Tax=Massilia sp. W12 TaxID=3126507 RepID=UPI0030CA7A1D
MSQQILVRRDTPAWIAQVWIAFILSLSLCAYGVMMVQLQDLEKAFIATGFVFVLFAALVLAKSLRDNQHEKVDTPIWRILIWIGFAASLGMLTWGLMSMALQDWQLAYLLVSGLFMLSSAFTVSKTIRDKHEADLVEGRHGASSEE